jgi:cysteine synthase
MKNNMLNLIGNTPLIQLNYNIPNAKILAKIEHFNLTGSIKDRMALYMLQKAQQKKYIKKNYTIIEATTGNTGISFAALSNIFGYKMIAVVPEGHSIERIQMMKAYGAEIRITPKELGPKGAIRLRDILAKKIKHTWVPDQFNNKYNVETHTKGIAREILQQTKGRFDYIIHGIGTGGTLMGIAIAIKQKYPHIKIIAVEPKESAVLSGGKSGNHNIQGIGEGFIPSIVNSKLIDGVITVHTDMAILETQRIAQKTGLLVGFSSGANIAAIHTLSKSFKSTKKVLTIFADRGERYLSISL